MFVSRNTGKSIKMLSRTDKFGKKDLTNTILPVDESSGLSFVFKRIRHKRIVIHPPQIRSRVYLYF